MTVISRMILHLEAGLVFARKAMAEIEETMENDSSADDTAESAEEIVTEEIADDEDIEKTGGKDYDKERNDIGGYREPWLQAPCG